VQTIVERLDRQHELGTTVDEHQAERVRSAVSGVDVELRVEVGAVELPIADILALRPGDVLPLRRPAASGVVVYAGDVAAYTGVPGRNANARAVQIGEHWEGA
jgi:flagellar motor switch protein FliM